MGLLETARPAEKKKSTGEGKVKYREGDGTPILVRASGRKVCEDDEPVGYEEGREEKELKRSIY